jgi:hypothetical protein
VSHETSGNTSVTGALGAGRRCCWLAALLLPAGCTIDRSLPPSSWPPPDFSLEVAYQGSREGPPVTRRFQVWADGLSVYRRSREEVTHPDSALALPVYSAVSAYRMLPEATRMLGRKVWRRSEILAKAPMRPADREEPDPARTPLQAPPPLEDQKEQIRFECRAMGDVRSAIAAGQVHGSLVSVLQSVNQYVPPGEEFRMPGLPAVPDDNVLIDVPRPKEDAAASFAFHLRLLTLFPSDLQLLLDAFALACHNADREAAEALLSRYRRMVGPPRQRPGREGQGDPRPPAAEELARFLPPG